MFSKIHEYMDKSDAKFVDDLSTPEEYSAKIRKLKDARLRSAIAIGIQFLLIFFIFVIDMFSSTTRTLGDVSRTSYLFFLIAIMTGNYLYIDLQIKMLMLYQRKHSQ